MVIRILDHVRQCYTSQDGAVISALIRNAFASGEKVKVSFNGVTDVPSSFVNGAFVALLDCYSFDYIRANLSVVDSTPQINDMIKRRFRFETEQLAHAA